MKTEKYWQRYVFALLALTWCGLGSASATEEPLPSPGISAPARECTATMKLGNTVLASVKITAGPDGVGGLATQFPQPDTCAGPVPCVRWDYKWEVLSPPSGVVLNNALVSVDSDVTISASNPAGAMVTKSLPPIFLVDTDGERFLRFGTGNVTTFSGSYFTPPGILPGTLTAAFTGKKGFVPVFARCALAGADNVGVQQNLATVEEKCYKITGATVCYQVDPRDGRVIAGTQVITADPDFNFVVVDADLLIDGIGKVIYTTPAQFSSEGSCNYTWTNTAGGRSTVSCTNCCIRKSTGKCVLAADLTDPVNQCKAGTYTPAS
jgi:hypothetical protein